MLPQKGEHTSVKIYLANQNTWRVAGGLVLKLANTRARLACFEDNQTSRRPLNETKPKMRNLFFVRFSLQLIIVKRPSKTAAGAFSLTPQSVSGCNCYSLTTSFTAFPACQTDASSGNTLCLTGVTGNQLYLTLANYNAFPGVTCTTTYGIAVTTGSFFGVTAANSYAAPQRWLQRGRGLCAADCHWSRGRGGGAYSHHRFFCAPQAQGCCGCGRWSAASKITRFGANVLAFSTNHEPGLKHVHGVRQPALLQLRS